MHDARESSAGRERATELLLCCARTAWEPSVTARVEHLLRAEPDWDILIGSAVHHGVFPLVYRSLRESFSHLVPGDALERLRRLFHAGALRSHFLTDGLIGILETLERHDIIAVPFKGPLLAREAYGDIALRTFADLDIFLQRRDAAAAMELLEETGFRPTFELTGNTREAFVRTQDSTILIHGKRRVIVDLQWGFTWEPFWSPFDLTGILDRTETVVLEGKAVRTFSREDLFPMLCAHGAMHGWNRLSWICDIAELIRSDKGLDWMTVVNKASSASGERILGLGVNLANRLLDAPPPAEIEEIIYRDERTASLCGTIVKRIIEGEKPSSEGLDRFAFHRRLFGRPFFTLKYALQDAFTPQATDAFHFRLPPSCYRLYFLLRPLRLLRVHLERFAGRRVQRKRHLNTRSAAFKDPPVSQ
jgi:hypothetical protein